MARYVVGDLQGCLNPLQDLLAAVRFDVQHDRLWVVGDLVNRGPQSVEVLRFLRSLGPAVTAVLGNHDLYLLALAAGVPAKNKPGDTLAEVLVAPDAAELFDWLRSCPLLHVEAQWAMVHAGLLPQWSINTAQQLASEVEAALRGPAWREFLQHLFGNQPSQWRDDLQGWDRHRIVINAMTRMRYLDAQGAIQLKAKMPPEAAPAGYVPWYAAPQAQWRSHTVLCGHWSALGYRALPGVYALDSGCVWGNSLTALRLEDAAVFATPCAIQANFTED